MKNFSKIVLLTVLSFLTTSQVFAETKEEETARLAATAPIVAKTDPTPLPAETLEKPIDDPKLTKVTPPAEPKKEEEKVSPASAAPEKKELAAPAAPAKSSWTVKSVLSGAISSVKGLFTSKSTPEVKKEEPKSTIAEPSAYSVKTTEPLAVEPEKVAPKKPLAPMTDEEKVAFLGSSSPLKKTSSALAAATGLKPPVAPMLPTEPEKVIPALDSETKIPPTDTDLEKVLTLKPGGATTAALAATEKIATDDDVLDVPASKKEVDEAVATIKATADPTATAEVKIRDYWETKNATDRRATQIKRTLAAAAITTLAGGLIGITVVLPIVLRIMAKKLEAEEQAHLKRLQTEAQGAQAKLDSLGETATDLDKLMVQQLGLDPDRLYKDSAFNKERGKETQSPTLKKLFRMLNHEPKQFLDAVEILREKEVAKLLTPREQEQLRIIRNLRPEDVAPLGFFGSLGRFFGFGPQSNETLDKIKSSWKKEYKSDEIAKLKEKHGAKTEISEPAKKAEDDQKLKTTPPAEEPTDATKKPKTPEELAVDEVEKAKKNSPLSPEVEKGKKANLAFDVARKALDEARNSEDPDKTKIQGAEESLSIAEDNLKRAQEAARDESELNATKKKSTQEIVKTTNQIINPIPGQVSTPAELATVIAKNQSQLKELPPAQTLEDQKIPAATDGESGKNQTPPTTETTQKTVDVVTEEIKQNAPILAFSQQSGSTVKTVPQTPINLNLRSAIPQPVSVEPSNVALTIKERIAAASEEKKAQQIAAPEDSIKALQAQITERKGSEISRALSYKDDRPDKESLTDLRMPVNDAIWKLAQEQSKTKGLPQNFLIDSAQLMADQFMSRRSERSAPLPPSTDAWTKANPEVERLTQSLGFGFGSQDSVAKKAESIATAKRLSSQTTTLLEQKREINPPLPPTSLPSPSSPRSPQQLYSHSSPTSKFMFGSPADVNRAWTQMSQQPLSQRPQSSPINVMGSPAAMGPSLAKPLHSPASINPGDIELLRRGFQQQNSSPSPKNDRPSESQPSRKMGL